MVRFNQECSGRRVPLVPRDPCPGLGEGRTVKRKALSRTVVRALALGPTALLALSAAAPAHAAGVTVTSSGGGGSVSTSSDAGQSAPASSEADDESEETQFNRVDLISDQMGTTPLFDADVQNAWGLALGPDTPLWVANNGTGVATMYADGMNGETPTKVDDSVTIPGGAPTGVVFNDTDEFKVKTPDGKEAPARFIFASEAGDITAVSRHTSTPGEATLVAQVDGAVYKGITIVHWDGHPFLLAANFHQNRIDVFDEHFTLRPELSKRFQDPDIPEGFAPFNVKAFGDSVFVTFAKQLPPDNVDDEAGPGNGFVDEFTGDKGLTRVASRGTLNSPWGLAFAPDSFGELAGALLVGNFGDGHINAFRDGKFLGQLRDQNDQTIVIDGLWSLLPGTAKTGGTGTLWFSAGPNGEMNGLVGQLLPADTN
nr:TIGR03118 family protein [Planosporangium flavigriseum]